MQTGWDYHINTEYNDYYMFSKNTIIWVLTSLSVHVEFDHKGPHRSPSLQECATWGVPIEGKAGQ